MKYRTPLVIGMSLFCAAALQAANVTVGINLTNLTVNVGYQDGGTQLALISKPLPDLFNALSTGAGDKDPGGALLDWIGKSQLQGSWTNADGTFTGTASIPVSDFSQGVTDLLTGNLNGAASHFGTGQIDFDWHFGDVDVLGMTNRFDLGYSTSSGFDLRYALTDGLGRQWLDYHLWDYPGPNGSGLGNFSYYEPEPGSATLMGSGFLLLLACGARLRSNR